ncbi:uncharacterized protein [Bemisia tabaci]|uniref:uncharacterized protein isoform X6 n=1 Tax=Bemisia tabaci TaxID=7038 RepID=UPI003B285A9B
MLIFEDASEEWSSVPFSTSWFHNRKKITMMKIMRIVMLELVKKVQSKKKRLRRRKSEHLMLKNFNSFLFSLLIKILI